MYLHILRHMVWQTNIGVMAINTGPLANEERGICPSKDAIALVGLITRCAQLECSVAQCWASHNGGSDEFILVIQHVDIKTGGKGAYNIVTFSDSTERCVVLLKQSSEQI